LPSSQLSASHETLSGDLEALLVIPAEKRSFDLTFVLANTHAAPYLHLLAAKPPLFEPFTRQNPDLRGRARFARALREVWEIKPRPVDRPATS